MYKLQDITNTFTMNILAWIILGGIAGWLGSLIAKTNAQQGIFLNIIVGIIGAFIAGFIFSLFGGAGITGFNLYSLLVATIGSVLLLGIVRSVRA
jgi:uncharacterized membrane protein YeaQ/YmgE (transglycosylase-associated protein family)